MAERATLTQGVQLGVETTSGTAVSADKKLNSTSIETKVMAEIEPYRPMGTKYATTEILGKEWSEFDIEGVGSYNDSVYLFASCLAAPTSTQQAATTAYLHEFEPSSTAEDTVKTYTIEHGSSVRAHKLAYGIITEVEFEFTRDGVAVSGSGMGQQTSDGITLTSSPTSVAEKPMLPTDVDVYYDTTSGGLGGTKLTRALSATITVSDRFGPLWVLNSANDSFVATLETEPTAEVAVMVEADTQGMGLLTDMRDTSTNFLRVTSTSSDEAGTGYPYLWQWDAAVKIKEIGEFSDEDGVYAIEWTFDMVHDPTWGKAMYVAVTNQLTTL